MEMKNLRWIIYLNFSNTKNGPKWIKMELNFRLNSISSYRRIQQWDSLVFTVPRRNERYEMTRDEMTRQ
jgi:hypothetical protein